MEQPPAASLPRSYSINQEGSEVRPEVLPASDSTTRIMLRYYVRPSIHRHPLGRSARRQERSFAPGPSSALARRKTPHFAGPRPQSARPYQGSRKREPSSLAPPFSSCRRVQHSCGSARCQRSCVGASPPHHLRPRSSKVSLRLGSTWPLFLQASAGKNPARSLPGVQDTAVRIRSRPLAQRVSAIFPTEAPLWPPHTAPVCAPHRPRCVVP